MPKRNQIMITALALLVAVAGYLNFAGKKAADENMLQVTGTEIAKDIVSMDSEATEVDSIQVESEYSDITDDIAGEIPGEAVFTSSTGVSVLSGARMQKEQTRTKNKESLLEIINNENVTESGKQEAINSMVHMTEIAEKETAAEILLDAKGFDDAIVSIQGDGVDVVVNTAELSEVDRAQIEDIVTRKTGLSADAVIISTVNNNGE
ncbi:MAG: SpoIIIAH-like family protein [Lachnospiraceae bacterium]|nr:SpoIIIAH-like family protein [Lachnospiraceae bacterium]